MTNFDLATWLVAMKETADGYRNMIEATVSQLSDAELHRRPATDQNSVAILLRHLGGNLQSRWTNFLSSDGEKPDRNRDQEFQDWNGSRDSLESYFQQGFTALLSAFDQIDQSNVGQPIFIRGERHTIPQALVRSLTHVSYHAGQIAMTARQVHQGEWRWLTIAPGRSQEHNQKTWGTSASRSVFSRDNDKS